MQEPTATGDQEEKTEEENPCWRRRHGKWSEKRAIILSKPDEALEVEPGTYVVAEVEVQNST